VKIKHMRFVLALSCAFLFVLCITASYIAYAQSTAATAAQNQQTLSGSVTLYSDSIGNPQICCARKEASDTTRSRIPAPSLHYIA